MRIHHDKIVDLQGAVDEGGPSWLIELGEAPAE